MMLRALLAVLACPGVVAVLVPLMLARHEIRTGAFRPVALVPLLAGGALLGWCIREFQVRGQGTLAPWDAPRHLVASGPYRTSRNPMYVAVIVILAGWALAYRSRALVAYGIAVAVAFHLRVVLGEEPRLARTHREAWACYRRQVPRWLGRPRDSR